MKMFEKEGKNYLYRHFTDFKKPFGFGFMIDFCPPFAMREEAYCVKLDLIWFRAYFIKYKKEIKKINPFEIDQAVIWKGNRFFVVEDEGDKKVCVTNSIRRKHPFRNYWWVDRSELKPIN